MKIIKQFLIQLYVMLRHPESIRLRRKGIRYDHYCEMNKKWILDAGIHTVIDVGANVGNFAKIMREVLPLAVIYSIEPLPDCYEKMKSVLPGDSRFHPINIAAGSKAGVLQFYRSFHSPSSSFLQMEDVHKEAFPDSVEGQHREALDIQVDTLDAILSKYEIRENILLKIDVQGFESEVIDGAPAILDRTKVIFIEMSFVGLYKNLPLFHEIYTRLYNKGFRYKGALAQMLHAKTGEVVQMDAIFIKE